MGTPGATETFFVVASTDMQGSGIMTTRVREQLDRVTDLKTKCAVTISTTPLKLPADIADKVVEQQVQTVADTVTHAIMAGVGRKQQRAAKVAQTSN
jgi:hypothetical protein